MKKLEKRSTESSNKALDDKESDKDSNHSEDFDDECIKKKAVFIELNVYWVDSKPNSWCN